MRTIDLLKFDEKRREIIAAATRSFLKEGLHSTSVATICAEANISAGNFYHYFAGKAEIIQAISEAFVGRVEKSIQSSHANGDLEALMHAELEKAQVEDECMIVLDLFAEAKRNPAVSRIVQSNTESLSALLEDLIKRGQRAGKVDSSLQPPITATLLLSLMDAALIARVRNPSLRVEAIRKSVALATRRLLAPQKPVKLAAAKPVAAKLAPRRRSA